MSSFPGGDSPTKKSVEAQLYGMIEALALIEHQRWAHWQAHVHSAGERQPDGSLLIPPNLVERWDGQIARSYFELSDGEKESDREQVRIYLRFICERLGC